MAVIDNHCEEADEPVGFHQSYTSECDRGTQPIIKLLLCSALLC